jgi:hypothetical protein
VRAGCLRAPIDQNFMPVNWRSSAVVCMILVVFGAWPAVSSQQLEIPLTIAKGVPLRVIILERVPIKRAGQPVKGRLAAPVYVYNREVLPAGTEVLGRLVKVQPVSRWRRAQEVMNGNLAPLHTTQVDFDALVLKDGERIPISTQVLPDAAPMIHLESGDPVKASKDPVSGLMDYAKQQIKSHEEEALSLLRGPDKMQRIMTEAKAEALKKLPYHREAFQPGTVFTAELQKPVELGTETLPARDLSLVGSPPPSECIIHARLITPLSSATARRGEPVKAVVTQPLYSKDHQLIIPQGSRLEGAVVEAEAARKLHRNGKLRFTFQRIEPPASRPQAIEASVQAVEAPRAEQLQLDQEGGVSAKESKQKYVAPTLAILATVWTSMPDEDAAAATGRVPGQGGATGQVVAGGWKLGALGSFVSLAAQSRPLTMALGAYGAAWSVYTHLVARGRDVVFPADTPMEIRLGNHHRPNAKLPLPSSQNSNPSRS